MTRLSVLLFAFIFLGCASGFFDQKIGIEGVITEKEAIDKMDNPALQYRVLNELQNKKIVLKNIVVKEVVESPRIDYNFCVLADVTVRDKEIECHIYSHSIRLIARLEKSKTVIDAAGKFDRFFSTLDNYYTKLEITDASIKIKE
jgi:hypothetical protein